MAQRGRKSAAALTVVPDAALQIIQRPKPPSELTKEQAHEWREVVDSLPANWFVRETWPLLIQYCRHITRARRLATLIELAEGAEDFILKEFRQLLADEDAQSRAMGNLATKMRISHQAGVPVEQARKMGVATSAYDAIGGSDEAD